MRADRWKKIAALVLSLALLAAFAGMGVRERTAEPSSEWTPAQDGVEDVSPLDAEPEPEPEPEPPAPDPLAAEPEPEPEPDPDPLSGSAAEEPGYSTAPDVPQTPVETPAQTEEEGPERDIDSIEGLEEATFNFTFQVDTLWQWNGSTMIFPVRNAATLIAAVNTIASLGEGEYIIALANDITMPAGSAALRFSCGHTILLGCGHTLHMQPGDGAEECIVVEGDAYLSLGTDLLEDDLTIQGRLPEDNGCFPSLISVRGGTLDIYAGVTLTGHRSGWNGGALRVTGGVATMYGGTISDCGVVGPGTVRGGGVYVLAGGQFRLYDGLVRGCYAVSLDGVSYGGGLAAADDPDREEPLSFDNAPVQLLGGRITRCAANIGGGAALDRFPGSVVLGGVTINYNACFGQGAAAAGGLWYEPAEGLALYVYDNCRIKSNDFCPEGTYTTGLEALGEDETPVRADVDFIRSEDETDRTEASDLRVPATDGKDDPACLRVGVLTDASIGLIAEPEALAASDGRLYATFGFSESNPDTAAEDVFFADSSAQRVSGFYEVILRDNDE